MRPELSRFFDSMAEYLEGSSDSLDGLRARYPGWDGSRSRMALYHASTRGHVEQALESAFPILLARTPTPAWTELVSGYLVTGARGHFDVSTTLGGFPSFVGDHAARLGLPAWAPWLARFEWTDLVVTQSLEEPPARP